MIIKASSSRNVAFSANGGRNESFSLAQYDYSFVGRVVGANPTKLVTAIGDNLVVAAKHYQLTVGDRIDFYNKLNLPVTVTVTKFLRQTGDVQVVVVDKSFTENGISIAEVAEINPSVISQFLAKLGLFRKQAVAFGVSLANNDTIATIVPVYSLTRANPANIAQFRQTSDGVTLEKGDSGAPDFIIEDGKLKLIGVHSAINAAAWITSSAYWAV